MSTFKTAMRDEPNDSSIVQRFLLHGSCHAISEQTLYDLKARIADNFDLEATTDIFVVGSAKLGFSIAPGKRWRHFGDLSDIDVALVNHNLYQKLWHELHDYHLSGADWPRRGQFVKAIAQGWLRPDLLPNSPSFAFANEWWEFFRGLKASRLAGPYKIAAGIYHDIHFLRSYQIGAVSACRQTLGE